MIVVARTDPRDPQATALLTASHALMQSLFNPEDNHYLSIDALCGDDVHFFTAREGATILGTGAIKVKKDMAEVKSMFVAETARGRGVADAILRALEDRARELRLHWMRLETGDVLHAAHRLYARQGFVPCGVFGDYTENPSSIFMEKRL
jgi:putative acetyltransferase